MLRWPTYTRWGDWPQIDNFVSFRTMLKRNKVSQMPKIPVTVKCVKITGPWAETWVHDCFLLYQDYDGNIHCCNWCKPKSPGEVPCKRSDGMFRSCPALYNQFIYVLGSYQGWVIHLVDVLMENKGIGHYQQVLAEISHHACHLTHQWRP